MNFLFRQISLKMMIEKYNSIIKRSLRLKTKSHPLFLIHKKLPTQDGRRLAAVLSQTDFRCIPLVRYCVAAGKKTSVLVATPPESRDLSTFQNTFIYFSVYFKYI